MATVVVIRCVPERVALTQGSEHALDVEPIHQILVGTAAAMHLGVFQHRIGVGTVNAYAGAIEAELAGIQLQSQKVGRQQQHALAPGHGGIHVLCAFHAGNGAHAPVRPEPSHAGLEDGTADAFEVGFEGAFPLRLIQFRQRQLQVAAGHFDPGFQYFHRQAAQGATERHLHAPGQQGNQQPQRAQAQPVEQVARVQQRRGKGGESRVVHCGRHYQQVTEF